MAQYYGYAGYGGIASPEGTLALPAGGTVITSEVTIAQVQLPDLRQPIQNGVLLTAFIYWGIATAGAGSIMCRQSTLGTTATTGAVVGGTLGTYLIPIATNAATVAPMVFQWVDQTGTFPIPGYNLTAKMASGGATIAAAHLIATPLGG